MNPILQTLFGWQFVIFGLTIAAIVYIIRTIVEYVIGRNVRVWESLIKPILPIILGALLGLVFVTFPYPDQLTNNMDRLVFGMVAGLLSGLIYRLIKAFLSPKISILAQIINAISRLIGRPEKQDKE